MKKFIIILSIILVAFIISFFTSKENSNQLISQESSVLKYVDGSFYFATLSGMENVSAGWIFRYSPADGEAKYFHNVEIHTSLLGNIVVTNPTDLEARLKSKTIKPEKNQTTDVDSKLLIGIWAEREDENAMFYLTKDSIYYTDHQDQPFAYKVNGDTLIMFGDIVEKWKILKLNSDSLWVSNDISKEITKLHKK